MRKFFIIISMIIYGQTFAEDTTWVKVHDATDMTWYGHYKQWGEFPDGSENYRKVMLHYTMGCASTGCSGWDYTTHITLRHKTGKYDSTLVLAPSFTVNGVTQDSLEYANQPTFTLQFDSAGVDTIYNDSIVVISYNNPTDPWLATDTSYVFAANYFYFQFDSLGNQSDSLWVSADNVIYLSNTNTYNVYEIIEEYELGRAITPYGTYMNPTNSSYGTNGYTEDWQHVFSYDITDFAHLLVDSVEIDAFYSGWSSGFSATTDFEFIEGIPARNVLAVNNVYKNAASSYSYSSSSDFETNQMPAKKLPTLSNAEEFEFRFTPSGHGQAGEFTPGIHYYLNVNGTSVGSNEMWKDDCGLNAVWPQGGTWIFDRANWCPGEAVPTFYHDITSQIIPGDSALFDVDFTSFNPTSGASYSCALQFFQYEAANFSLNAEIVDIISPSTKDIHSRFNPVCGNPKIKIKNLGTTTLNTLDIEYEMEGGSTETFNWTGNLDYLKSEEVTLPSFLFNGSDNIFNVRISNPNGGVDEQKENDFLSSSFELVPDYPNEFKVVIDANNFGNENSWIISDMDGTALYWKFGLTSNQYNIDTVNLPNGCYLFELTDNGKDGLDFWWSNATTGTGSAKFQQVFPPIILETFHPDFGSKIIHHFTVGGGVSTIEEEVTKPFNIYPNPTTGQIQIELTENNQPFNVQLYNILGEALWDKKIKVHSSQTRLNISEQPNGIYLLKLQIGDRTTIERIILNR